VSASFVFTIEGNVWEVGSEGGVRGAVVGEAEAEREGPGREVSDRDGERDDGWKEGVRDNGVGEAMSSIVPGGKQDCSRVLSATGDGDKEGWSGPLGVYSVADDSKADVNDFLPLTVLEGSLPRLLLSLDLFFFSFASSGSRSSCSSTTLASEAGGGGTTPGALAASIALEASSLALRPSNTARFLRRSLVLCRLSLSQKKDGTAAKVARATARYTSASLCITSRDISECDA